MKAAIIECPGKITIREVPSPKYGPYEAMVKMELVSICNSTDIKIKEGKYPAVNDYPLIIGHEGIGVIESTGEKVRYFKKGDRVINPMSIDTGIKGLGSAWGTMAEFALIRDYKAIIEDDAIVDDYGLGPEINEIFITQKTIPTDISSEQAILLSTWREIYSSFTDFNIKKGKSLLIIGGGPVGLSFVAIAKCIGMNPICLSTRSNWKLEKALLLGADKVFQADNSLVSSCRDYLKNGFDIVIDAVGHMEIINQALKIIAHNGTVAVYGTLYLKDMLLKTEKSPDNWNIILHRMPDSKKEAESQEPLIEFIKKGKLSSKEFISHTLPFDQIKEGFDLIAENKALKVILKFDN